MESWTWLPEQAYDFSLRGEHWREPNPPDMDEARDEDFNGSYPVPDGEFGEDIFGCPLRLKFD